MRLISFLLLAAACAMAQNAVTIRVKASETIGPFKPIYAYFGYDEPNYTYTKNGRKLVGELAAMSAAPVYIRTHFMLATGDGTPGLSCLRRVSRPRRERGATQNQIISGTAFEEPVGGSNTGIPC